MKIRSWGTRGSIATPGPATVRFGGNTSCVEIRSDAGTLLVVDCGTGARALGQALVAEEAAAGRPLSGSILIGHTHWDHIQGLPFFAPLFGPGGRWRLYGPRGLGRSLGDTLAGQMQYQYFPLTLEQFGAEVSFHDLVEGTFEIDDVTITTHYLNHPALTLGYRIEADGVSVVYASDHEPHDRALAAGGDLMASAEDARHVAFLRDADVVIHDAQYTAEEYADRTGWGHSTLEYVVDAARLAGVRRLVLHHHDPTRDDAAVDAFVARARERAAATGYAGTIEAAAEGHVLEVARDERAPVARVAATPSATRVPAMDEVAAAVIVAVSDPALAVAVTAAADAEQLRVRSAGPAELVEVADRTGRAVLVVDLDDETLVDTLRGCGRGSTAAGTAVVGLTRRVLPMPAPPQVTEWLVWPCTVAHVRTKLRAAVLRRACRWQAAPQPPDEEARVHALHALGVLDTEPEDRFDRYTEEACRALGVPIALVTLVDRDRQWFKSHRGTEAQETPRDQSVCAHAILGTDVLQVPDLLEDDRFADNPMVAGPLRARFYAGVPLVLSDGSTVGTLCVADQRPRVLDDAQLDELRRLGSLVQAELEASVPTATA